jgi:hypothetical protein
MILMTLVIDVFFKGCKLLIFTLITKNLFYEPMKNQRMVRNIMSFEEIKKNHEAIKYLSSIYLKYKK